MGLIRIMAMTLGLVWLTPSMIGFAAGCAGYLMEDGVSYYLLENGSDKYAMESGAGCPSGGTSHYFYLLRMY